MHPSLMCAPWLISANFLLASSLSLADPLTLSCVPSHRQRSGLTAVEALCNTSVTP